MSADSVVGDLWFECYDRLKIIAGLYGYNPLELKSPCANPDLTEPRRACVRMLRDEKHLTWPQIARMMSSDPLTCEFYWYPKEGERHGNKTTPGRI